MQIWIQNAKITLWKNFGQFFRFHRFWSFMQKKDHFSKYMGLNINLGCIWIHNAKITLWKNLGQFFRFHQFCHQRKKKHFSTVAVFQNIWDLHKFGLQIWIQNLPYERISGNFSISSILIKVRVLFFNISCNSKYMGFT